MRDYKTLAVNALAVIAFAVLSMILLTDEYGLYLRKTADLSFFMPGTAFFTSVASTPAGTLAWCGCFLTQFFHHPLLGGALLTILLVFTAWLTARAFGIGWRFFPACLLVPSMLLLEYLRYGYAIYSLRAPGFAFAPVLGVIAAECLYIGWRRCPCAARIVVSALTVVVGYPLIGVYALLAAALQLASSVARVFDRRDRHTGLCIALCVAIPILSVAVPLLWCSLFPDNLAPSVAFTVPMPVLEEGETCLLWPSAVTALFLVLAAACDGAGRKLSGWLKTRQALSVTVCVAALVSVAFFRYSDPNFMLTLSLDRDVRDGRWSEAVDALYKFEEEPTRLNVMLAQVAMIHTGEAPQRIFTLPTGCAPYETARALRVTHEAGALPISYHLGMANYAARWAMEANVEFGNTAEGLGYLARIALLNGNYDLARKYALLLSRTLFHKEEAQRLLALADDPALIAHDAELAPIAQLRTDSDSKLDDGGSFEPFIWRHLSNITPRNSRQLDLALVASLMHRRLDRFAALLSTYPANGSPLPRHFQEGILFYGAMFDNTEYAAYRFTTDIVDRLNAFMTLYNRYPVGDSALVQASAPVYGGTYWFYHIVLPYMVRV